MAKFRNIRTFQKFAAVHASVQNHFHQDRHLNRRTIFKQKRAVALASGVIWQPKISGSGRFGDQFALD